ncbi:sugar ABC transporter substrate-binding protein [Patescibacteria group bacterium]|nr:sugar ABC transporter substrate-binding protein [Patescibacteria group bacterium]
MKKIVLTVITLSLILLLFGTAVSAKKDVNFFLALYDGLRPEYYQDLNRAFNKANPDIDLKIIPVDWNNLHDKLVIAIAGGRPPDLSVIGTRWLLEFLDIGVVEPIEKYLSKELLDNIEPGTMEARINNILYALPVAAGPRFLYYRSDIFEKYGMAVPPDTFEEMLTCAQKINDPPNFYGAGMSGKKYVELTEFAYYLLGNDGYFFEINPDGSYGKCRINDEAGIEALTFMNDLVSKYKVTQPGVTAYTRDDVQDLFVSGKLGIILIGAYTDVILKQRGVSFKWDYGLIPRFAGKDRHSLMITDSIMMFKASKNKEAAAKFLEFFYQDKWRFEFNKQVGFPPVLKSVGKMPYYQAPIYKVMVESMPGAKGWPLVSKWAECNDIIWNAIGATFLGQKTPKQAMNEAAAKIDGIQE